MTPQEKIAYDEALLKINGEKREEAISTPPDDATQISETDDKDLLLHVDAPIVNS